MTYRFQCGLWWHLAVGQLPKKFDDFCQQLGEEILNQLVDGKESLESHELLCFIVTSRYQLVQDFATIHKW